MSKQTKGAGTPAGKASKKEEEPQKKNWIRELREQRKPDFQGVSRAVLPQAPAKKAKE